MNKEKSIYYWLLSGCLLIALMIIIGGITRLTQSGLSMVEWKPIVGAIPPLNEEEWIKEFNLYKKSPEFKVYNNHFTLKEFKSIFFWEYLHRLVGRVIGLVFIIPCLIFWLKGRFSTDLKKRVLLILLGGICQGILGWLMVKSGLVKNPHVSHYRLAAHLMAALILIIYIYKTALWVKHGEKKRTLPLLSERLINRALMLLILQIIYGAFVAGLKAGKMYNTFPKMGDSWFPSDLTYSFQEKGMLALFESPSVVQLIHRILGISCFFLATYILIKSKEYHFSIRSKTRLFGSLIFIQVAIGITTLILSVPVNFGVLHQIVALIILVVGFNIKFASKYEWGR